MTAPAKPQLSKWHPARHAVRTACANGRCTRRPSPHCAWPRRRLRGHEDDGPLRSRCRKPVLQLDSRNSLEVNVKQKAGCRLHAVALKQRLGRGERTAVDRIVRQQARHALQKARIVIDDDHDCRLRHHIRVQPRGYMSFRMSPTLDLDQWNLVRHEHTTNGSSPGEALEQD
jgi:hypothetical protein